MTDTKYDNTNKGAIFRNTDKVKDEDRDYSGTLNVDGTDFWVSGWIRTSKKGTKFLSLAIKLKDAPRKTTAPNGAVEKRAAADFNDEIPF